MKKNVVYWIGVKNEDLSKKYGGFDYFEYSKSTWKYWCEKNDCLFVEFDTPVELDLFKYRVNWQKAMFVFDEMDKRDIDYDQIALVDSSSIVKWDCPNFFDLCDDRMVAWRDMANLNWIYHSVKGYESMMRDTHDSPNFDLDISKYINCGSIIVNENHREFLGKVKEFYDDYKNELIHMQDRVVKKGTDQTPFNYLLQLHNIDVNIGIRIAT